MTGVKISALPAAGTLTGAEVVPVVQGGVTRRATLAAVRSGQPINVLDFGASPLLADNTAAFQAAVNAIPAGQARDILIPGTAEGSVYNLPNVVNNNGRLPRFILDTGVTLNPSVGSKFQQPTNYIQHPRRTDTVTSVGTSNVNDGWVLLRKDEITNQGAIPGQSGVGIRTDYHSFAYGNANDIGRWINCWWDVTDGQNLGSHFGFFLWAASPAIGNVNTKWSTVATEMNVVNRGPDTGWSKRRGASLDNWTAVMQLAPMGADGVLPGTWNNITVLLALATDISGGNLSPAGYPVAAYTGFSIEPKVIAPGGYGGYWSGNDTGNAARDPIAALALDDHWQYGIDGSAATFTGAPIVMPFKTPATAAATGKAGSICWDANYIYVCTALNTWKRAALATW